MQWLVATRLLELSGPNTFVDLLAACAADAGKTELIQLKDPQDLLLHPEAGMTRSQLRFNTVAFQQVCSLLSGGLFSLLAGLESETAGSLTPENQLPRQRKLIGIYNTVVGFVGAKLNNYRLVVDRRADNGRGVVVGIVGKSYRYVSNFDLLTAVRPYQQREDGYAALKATLRNRDLFLLMSRRRGGLAVDGVKFNEGTAVYNSETTKRAIFLPKVVFDSETRSYSHESESVDNKLIHRKKKKFDVHLDGVVQTAFTTDSVLQALQGRMLNIRKTALCGEDRSAVAFRAISGKLIARGINTTPIERVVLRLSAGGWISQWSLYAAMVRVAAEYHSSERRLRMAAYQYLVEGSF